MEFSLTDLTVMVRKCCARPENATALTSRYQFEIDFAKLENMLKQKKTNLHTIGLNKTLLSRPISIAADSQMISEYINNMNVLQACIGEGTEIVQFMMFSTENINGTNRPKYEDEAGNIIEIQDKELFNMLNDPTQINEDLIKELILNYPIYRVIVIRFFNERNDRYEYNVNIRSNALMMGYMKYLKDKDAGEVVNDPAEETATEEVAAEEVETKPEDNQDK